MLVLIVVWVLFGVVGLVALSANLEREPMAERYWPTAVALGLALLSWPLVALSLDATVGESFTRVEPPVASRWTAALSAVLLSALVAGTLGGPLTRRHVKVGVAFTFVLALLVATPALPILPKLLGQNVGAGWVCFDACGDVTSTENLSAGFFADLFFPFALVVEPVPVFVLAVGTVAWSRLIGKAAPNS